MERVRAVAGYFNFPALARLPASAPYWGRMAMENDWIVWLNDQAGKALLGLTHSPQNSRFCVLGKTKGEAFSVGIGILIEVDHVEERIMPDNRLSRQWSVSPKTCLIP